jgi:hypothetical protein
MRIYRVVAVALLVTQAGCYNTRIVTAPATELTGTHPTSLLVTRTDGQVVTVRSGRVMDDTIYGFDRDGDQYALALRDSKLIRVRELNMTKSVLLGAGIALATGVFVYVVRGKGPTPLITTDCDKHPDVPECMPK